MKEFLNVLEKTHQEIHPISNEMEQFTKHIQQEGIHSKGDAIVPKIVFEDRRLDINTKMLYIYLFSQYGENQSFKLSDEAVCRCLGITYDDYFHSMKELTILGYLEQSSTGTYQCQPYPRMNLALMEEDAKQLLNELFEIDEEEINQLLEGNFDEILQEEFEVEFANNPHETVKKRMMFEKAIEDNVYKIDAQTKSIQVTINYEGKEAAVQVNISK